MPNTNQTKKRMRQDEERRLRNKAARTSMRTAVKRVLQAESAEDAAKVLPTAMKLVDKAAKKNIIHQNAAARVKSRLSHAASPK